MTPSTPPHSSGPIELKDLVEYIVANYVEDMPRDVKDICAEEITGLIAAHVSAQLAAKDREIARLAQWKREQITVLSWWTEVDDYIRTSSTGVKLGESIAKGVLRELKEIASLRTELEVQKYQSQANAQAACELAAVDAALATEFGPTDTRSGDIIEDMTCFVAHHKAKEAELAALRAQVGKSAEGARTEPPTVKDSLTVEPPAAGAPMPRRSQKSKRNIL